MILRIQIPLVEFREFMIILIQILILIQIPLVECRVHDNMNTDSFS